MSDTLLSAWQRQRPAGSVSWDTRRHVWRLHLEPWVAAFAERLFPELDGSRQLAVDPSPRNMELLHLLRLRYPLTVAPETLWSQHLDAAQGVAERRVDAAAVEPTANLPTLDVDLLWWQREDAPRMVAVKRCIYGAATGTGKTYTGIAAVHLAEAWPALIVVQPHVVRQWAGELHERCRLETRPVEGGLDFGERCAADLVTVLRGLKPHPIPSTPYVLIHYGLLHAWGPALARQRWGAVIYDEVQELRRPESKKHFWAARINRRAGYVWGLSATPIYNYGDEMHSIGDALEPGVLGTEHTFRSRWCGGPGERVVEEPEKLRDYLRSEGFLILRSKAETIGTLGGKRRMLVRVDHDSGIYAREMAEAVRIAGTATGAPTWGETGLALRNMAQASRQAAGRAKVGSAAAFIRSLLAAGERVVIGAHHHQVHDELTEAIGAERVVHITGRQTGDEKATAVARFASGDADAVLIGLRSATGIDGLQGAATCVVIVELDWTDAVHQQLEDRVYRLGRTAGEPLLCYYIVADSSYDQVVSQVLDLKIQQAAGLGQEQHAFGGDADVQQAMLKLRDTILGKAA